MHSVYAIPGRAGRHFLIRSIITHMRKGRKKRKKEKRRGKCKGAPHPLSLPRSCVFFPRWVAPLPPFPSPHLIFLMDTESHNIPSPPGERRGPPRNLPKKKRRKRENCVNCDPSSLSGAAGNYSSPGAEALMEKDEKAEGEEEKIPSSIIGKCLLDRSCGKEGKEGKKGIPCGVRREGRGKNRDPGGKEGRERGREKMRL